LVRDIGAGSPSSNPSYLMNVGGYLFFVANDGIHGAEIWVSQGMPVTTNELLDLGPGSAGSSPTALKDANGNLMFIADDGIHGAEPWVYVLTSGVATVLDLRPGAAGCDP